MRKPANFIAFQAGWLACVFGAAAGRPWLGPLVVVVLLGAQWALWWRSRAALGLLASAAALGFAADSLLTVAGLLSFPARALSEGMSPAWMVVLWPNFASTLLESLSWLEGRYLWAAVLGAIGGPLAYWGGEQFGAIRLAGGSVAVAVAAEWALATPLLLALASRTRSVAR